MNSRHWIFLFFIFPTLIGFGQEGKANESVFRQQSGALYSLFYYLEEVDHEKFNVNLDSIRAYSNTVSGDKKRFMLHFIRSMEYLEKENLFDAFTEINKVYSEDIQLDLTDELLAEQQLGFIYSIFGDEELAEKHLLHVFEKIKKQKFKQEYISKWLTQMYIEKGESQKAVEILKKSQVFPNNKQLDAYFNIGTRLYVLKKYDDAEYYLNKADSLEKLNPNKEDRMYIECMLGQLKIKTNKIDEGKAHLLEVVKVSNPIPSMFAYISSNEKLIQQYFEEGKKDSCLLILNGYYVSPKLNFDYQSSCYALKAEYYKKCGVEQDYLAALAQSYDYKDSLLDDLYVDLEQFALLKNNQLNLLQENLKIKNEKNAAIEQKNSVYLYLMIILAILVIISVLFFFFRLRKNKELERIRTQLATAELERVQISAAKLEMELKAKKMDLHQMISSLTLKQEFNKEQRKLMKELLAKDTDELKSELDRLYNQMKSFNAIEEHMDTLQSDIDNVNNVFVQKLKSEFPTLTQNDIEICSLHMLNLNTKQIATMRNVSPKAIQIARYRIKKKMGLNEEVDLMEYIEKNIF